MIEVKQEYEKHYRAAITHILSATAHDPQDEAMRTRVGQSLARAIALSARRGGTIAADNTVLYRLASTRKESPNWSVFTDKCRRAFGRPGEYMLKKFSFLEFDIPSMPDELRVTRKSVMAEANGTKKRPRLSDDFIEQKFKTIEEHREHVNRKLDEMRNELTKIGKELLRLRADTVKHIHIDGKVRVVRPMDEE